MSKSLATIIGLLIAATGSSAYASAEPSLIETSNSDAARKVLAELRCDIERDLATRLDGLRRDGLLDARHRFGVDSIDGPGATQASAGAPAARP